MRKHRHSDQVLFINTLLQQGVGMVEVLRASAVFDKRETVEIETARLRPAQNTR
jgi:hypothetical protein